MNSNTCCQSRLHVQCRLGLSNHYARTASLPLFKIGLLHIDSFTKSSDTALWHWTPSVTKCTSIEESARKDSMPRFKIYTLHSIMPRNSFTSLRALLAEVYVSSSCKRRNSFQVTFSMLGTTLAMEERDFSWPSGGLHQPCSQLPLREALILTSVCPLFQPLAGEQCCTPKRSNDCIRHRWCSFCLLCSCVTSRIL